MNSVKDLNKINMLASMPCTLRDMFEDNYLEMITLGQNDREKAVPQLKDISHLAPIIFVCDDCFAIGIIVFTSSIKVWPAWLIED